MLKLTLAIAVEVALASKPPILYYAPSSKVTDHARIDLDQKALEGACSTAAAGGNWVPVMDVYSKGAHSKPKSACDIADAGGAALTAAIATGSATVTTVGGVARTVTVDSAVAIPSPAGKGKIVFKYGVSDQRVEPAASACFRGGLPATSHVTAGCVADGTVLIGTTTYDITNCAQAQSAGRTLQGFSTKARKYMLDNKDASASNPCPSPTSNGAKTYVYGCPYVTYKPFFDYYCAAATTSCNAKGDYVNQMIVAATGGTKTTFTNFDFDFTTTAVFTTGAGTATIGAGGDARKQVIKKGSKFLGAMMYAIREFEDAIDDCTGGNLNNNELSSGSVHAWDEGVAFYVGSKMELDHLSGAFDPTKGGTVTASPYTLSSLSSQGCMSYSLGNKRCKNFKTCGPDGNAAVGEAKANTDLWPLFNAGQQEILTGNCGKAVPIKDRIMQKMSIPLIQGTLRYAYESGERAGDADARAEGAIFAAGILPLVHKCSATDAATIAQHMSLNAAAKPDFAAVKVAFENNYACLGVKCSEIGGYLDSTGAYYTKAAPCADPVPAGIAAAGAIVGGGKDKDGERVGIIVGSICGVLALLMLIFVWRLVSAEKKGKPIFAKIGNTV